MQKVLSFCWYGFAERFLEPSLPHREEPAREVKPHRRKSLDHLDPAMAEDSYYPKFLETIFFFLWLKAV